MRIVCPKCGAAYEVPEAMLQVPRVLKCAHCGESWQCHVPEDRPDDGVAPAEEDDTSADQDHFHDDESLIPASAEDAGAAAPDLPPAPVDESHVVPEDALREMHDPEAPAPATVGEESAIGEDAVAAAMARAALNNAVAERDARLADEQRREASPAPVQTVRPLGSRAFWSFAWGASVVGLAALGGLVWLEHGWIVTAWPPSAHLFTYFAH
ncbi:zinc-ribbon domain-containing protein [Brytella acorum]|uniref:Zinc-ribbon domain-containing protein n=1 Tax=Brytella acorum TaxID=2959299 RepID=A0AA35XWR8_9PROT|nr:zinc-ribbon domain-containing protein [Brytella acorum]MDF3624267.1 zinc-ribbon domain-containing protein [Brytella acorum]CAI9121159.1 zinc-ribbon domain-containing protein [Brytella acorum]